MTNQDTAKKIIDGKVALLPTETVYGLMAIPTNPNAVQKIYDLKQRPLNLNLQIMVADVKDLDGLGVEISRSAQLLLASHLVPGDLTIIFGLNKLRRPEWLNEREECAVRIPNHSQLLSILRITGPLLATSANRHGTKQTPDNVPDILKELNGKPDIIIDEGIIKNQASTIINCRVEPPKIERIGRVSQSTLSNILTQ